MSVTLVRNGFVMFAVAMLSTPLFSLDADKWSSVQNKRSVRLSVVISDLANTTGALHVRKAGEKGDGVLLDKPKKATSLDPNTSYEFYFETSTGLSQLALKFKVADEKNPDDGIEFRVSNLGKSLGAVESFEIMGKSLKKTPVLVDPSGYRNGSGGTLLTFK